MAGSSLGAEAAGNLVFQFRPTGKGDQPISGETEDVVLEVPKTFKETAEFSFANPAAFPGNFFRLRMDGHSFFDKRVILPKISVQWNSHC